MWGAPSGVPGHFIFIADATCCIARYNMFDLEGGPDQLLCNTLSKLVGGRVLYSYCLVDDGNLNFGDIGQRAQDIFDVGDT